MKRLSLLESVRKARSIKGKWMDWDRRINPIVDQRCFSRFKKYRFYPRIYTFGDITNPPIWF